MLPSQSFWFALYAVVGLLFGSFGNVVVWRFPRGESVVFPGSHCPACGAAVRWHDNVPVLSWVALRGRCRDCSAPISARYPVVEALSAVLWLAAAAAYGPGPRGLVAAVFFWALLVLSFIDFDTMRLPNAIVALLAALGAAAALASELTGRPVAPLVGVAASGVFASPLLAAVGGAAAAGGLSLGIAALYASVRGRAGFGMGDVKLLAAMGPFLGAYALLALVAGSLAGSVAGVALAIRSGEPVSAMRIPFGPFLALGGVAAALAGPSLVRWYASLVALG
ncbi:MAG: prepilin peptidase [Coriobacteriia bacterium]|nr:prepilin peptidase [Coriobacteriia bacterium]